MVNGWLQIVQGLILPPNCILCGDRGQPPVLDLCRQCAADLPANPQACRQCAAPLYGAAGVDLICGGCLGTPRRFDRAIVPFRYGYPLDHLIRAFKYQGVLAYGRVLGSLLAEQIRLRGDPLPGLLIPVPLHWTRHQERGFNQAVELARPVVELLGVPVDVGICRRKRATEDQTLLSARERRRNVRGAFELTEQPATEHVALLDDVLTTCSTVNEIARLLKRAGIKRVDVWAIARAGDDHQGQMHSRSRRRAESGPQPNQVNPNQLNPNQLNR